jgi:CPA2 family monovalent cation:H+ antiporter-2
VEAFLKRFPAVWKTLDRHGPTPAPVEVELARHVVVVGYGRVGRHIVDVLEQLNVPRLVIETDVERVEALNRRGVPTLYGDAANSEVLTHAGLESARALVVTTPEDATNELIVAAAHDLAPDLPLIARAATETGVTRLSELGAKDVIHPEMEGGLHIVRHLLLQLGFPLREVHRFAEAVRRDHYDLQVNSQVEHRLLDELVHAIDNIEVTWLSLPENNPLAGQTVAEANLRARTGASIVAILRDRHLIANPKSNTVFLEGDRLGFIGERGQIEAVEEMLGIEE